MRPGDAALLLDPAEEQFEPLRGNDPGIKLEARAAGRRIHDQAIDGRGLHVYDDLAPARMDAGFDADKTSVFHRAPRKFESEKSAGFAIGGRYMTPAVNRRLTIKARGIELRREFANGRLARRAARGPGLVAFNVLLLFARIGRRRRCVGL